MGEFLRVDDYIQSPQGIFFAIQQSDGNFCVYHGSGPDDNHGGVWCSSHAPGVGQYFAIQQTDGNFCVYRGPSPNENHGGVWCTMQAPGQGRYFAVIQDDGNFCVYRGSGLDDNRGGVWCSMHTDPVADFKIRQIEYDVAAAQILKSGPAELYRQTVRNSTQTEQTPTIEGSESLEQTSSWSDSLGITVGVSTSFACGVPLVAEGKVDVSVEANNTYTWSGSETKSKTWSWSAPLTVPPSATASVIVSTTLSTIAVPYTLSGTFVFKSGTQMPGKVHGLYTGSNSHDLTVTYATLTPGSNQVTVQDANLQ
ncbi:MAG: ETX/MTX2 family pore-forming toxin [Dermatophilaceae bacterium]